jgi:hypothetical protein
MTQTTISSNGHGTDPATTPEPSIDLTNPMTTAERRQSTASPSVSPEVLVERHVENARRQLAEARERLKAARRRVVQLEDAVGNWERFAAELRNGRDPGA